MCRTGPDGNSLKKQGGNLEAPPAKTQYPLWEIIYTYLLVTQKVTGNLPSGVDDKNETDKGFSRYMFCPKKK